MDSPSQINNSYADMLMFDFSASDQIMGAEVMFQYEVRVTELRIVWGWMKNRNGRAIDEDGSFRFHGRSDLADKIGVWFEAEEGVVNQMDDIVLQNKLIELGIADLFGSVKNLALVTTMFKRLRVDLNRSVWDKAGWLYFRCFVSIGYMLVGIEDSFRKVYRSDSFQISLRFHYHKADKSGLDKLSYSAVAHVIENDVPRKIALFAKIFPASVDGVKALTKFSPDLSGCLTDLVYYRRTLGVVHECEPVCCSWYVHQCTNFPDCECLCGAHHHYQTCGDQCCDSSSIPESMSWL